MTAALLWSRRTRNTRGSCQTSTSPGSPPISGIAAVSSNSKVDILRRCGSLSARGSNVTKPEGVSTAVYDKVRENAP